MSFVVVDKLRFACWIQYPTGQEEKARSTERKRVDSWIRANGTENRNHGLALGSLPSPRFAGP